MSDNPLYKRVLPKTDARLTMELAYDTSSQQRIPEGTTEALSKAALIALSRGQYTTVHSLVTTTVLVSAQ